VKRVWHVIAEDASKKSCAVRQISIDSPASGSRCAGREMIEALGERLSKNV
jgi:hypothetical protein